MSEPPCIVLDTNVLVSALRSNRGAAHLLVSRMGGTLYRHTVSTTLVLEYEDVLLRHSERLGLSSDEVAAFLDYVVSAAELATVHYRWRPFLNDPGDECVLELAVAAGADVIVTYNKRDFCGVEQGFGLGILTAKEFLQQQGVIP